jgi:membrane protein
MFAVTNAPWQRQWINFAKALWRQFNEDDILNGAAVLAFFFLLAAFPAAIFVLSLLPSLSIPHLQQAIVDLLHQVLPEQSANLFEGTVRYASSGGKEGLLTFGLIFALWSGSSGVYAITEQLNAICDHTERRPFWKARGMAVVLTLFFAVLTIGTLCLVIFGGAIQSWIASFIGWSQPLRIFFATMRWIILVAAGLFALAVAYRFGPDVKARFRFISPGNVAAALMIAIASVGFRFYVSKFGDYSATYGSLAAVIVLMLWMYLAGIALLVGWEINKLLRPTNHY